MYAVLLLAFVGIVLRSFMFMQNTPLVWDEAAVAVNVIQKSFTQLGSLSFIQHHPYLFLVITKLIVNIAGRSEWALRLIPFVAGLASIFLFYCLAKKSLGSNFARLALALFILCPSLILYGAFFREFSSDVLVGIVIYLFTFNFLAKKNPGAKNYIIFSIIGIVSVWLSFPAIFLLAGIGITISIHYLVQKNQKDLKKFIIMSTFWVLSFLIYFLFIIHKNPPEPELLEDFSVDFLPLPLNFWSITKWMQERTYLIFSSYFGPFIFPSLLAFIFGIYSFYKKSRLKIAIFASPIALAVLVSLFRWYPPTARHLLFATPAIFIISAEGISFIGNFFKNSRMKKFVVIIIAGAILAIELAGMSSLRSTYSTQDQEGVKPLLGILKERYQQGDSIYLHNTVDPVYTFYSPQYPLTNVSYYYGIPRTDNFELYIKNLSPLLGKKRVWLLFAVVFSPGQANREAYILKGLESTGKQIEHYRQGVSDLYLFDLSKN